jgi:hypothetical protein
MKYVIASTFGVLAMALFVGVQAGDAKLTIKDVMKKAMAKDGIVNKVKAGTATDAEEKSLVEMFTFMHDNQPKKGSADNWKKMTDALIAAAKSGDGKALNAAAQCQLCHKEFKGK